MLNRRGDDVTLGWLGRQRILNCGVVTFRAATGEDNFPGFGINESGNLVSCVIQGAGEFMAERIRARRVAPVVSQVGQHRFDHFRSNSRSGIIVEVNK